MEEKERNKRKDYSPFIYKVLKQVHPDTEISPMAMRVMEDLMNDLFERIVAEARLVARYNKRSTISSKEIQTAVKLLLPHELAKNAVFEGSKAMIIYHLHHQKLINF